MYDKPRVHLEAERVVTRLAQIAFIMVVLEAVAMDLDADDFQIVLPRGRSDSQEKKHNQRKGDHDPGNLLVEDLDLDLHRASQLRRTYFHFDVDAVSILRAYRRI